MEEVKVIHDKEGHTLTIWIDDPKKETVCEETADEVVMMKDRNGRVIGFEVLNYKPPKDFRAPRARATGSKGRVKRMRATTG